MELSTVVGLLIAVVVVVILMNLNIMSHLIKFNITFSAIFIRTPIQPLELS